MIRKSAFTVIIAVIISTILLVSIVREDENYEKFNIVYNDIVKSFQETFSLKSKDVDNLSNKIMDKNKANGNLTLNDNRVIVGVIPILLGVIFLIILYIIWLRVLKPFKEMNKFAERIATGNLDVPLPMDRSNAFGTFTESFDIMRSEIYSAREKERIANESKKELVASLSHDIRTPIASIKSVIDVNKLKIKDDNIIEQLNIIDEKVDRINGLVDDIFTSTMEERKKLEVSVEGVSSNELKEIIKNADYKNKIQDFIIPECLVSIDKVRFTEVIENIVSNSYKYADTLMHLKSYYEDDYLILEIEDEGNGVSKEELPLLTNKFYRGDNSKSQLGSGLGLYIAKTLIETMGGEFKIDNVGGLRVIIAMKLWKN
ncbi:MAG: HAMP domain-containing histidine kinase [Lachnospiraceae bacterium]|jgi:signal transduction histidine kinase|nr:HAMP domain-containing histidine kinase [Lachnospiraceae bacterium]